MPLTESAVLDALRAVKDPDLGADIVSLGFVKRVTVKGDKVAFQVELTTPACPAKEAMRAECEKAVLSLDGVAEVKVDMTARVREREARDEDPIPQVKQCVAIASGKGGVGKSTVAVNLAVALSQQGAKVGLLDADVYGPSVPLMMGCVDERPPIRGNRIVPVEKHGVKMMSIGFMLEEGQAVLWRGPLVAATVRQLLSDVDWGELDYLLVDLPPGTGDAPMSLAQLAPLSGVAIVTTPQSVAASIAAKSAALFRRLEAPILGIIENMATFVCPECGHETRVFAGMTSDELARAFDAPYLGCIPLDPEVSRAADGGTPAILAAPESAQAEAFRTVAGKLAAAVSVKSVKR